MPGPPLDAMGVLTCKLLDFLVGQRPSAQEERGDGRLDNARQLARDAQEVISPSDWEIVREMITLTTEIKMGVESRKILSRYLQAREYRKAAKDTLKFVKTVSDRARDATIGYNSAFPGHDAVQRPRGLEHAGVPPDPVTGLSRLPPGDLDAVREEDDQPIPTASPDHDDHVTPSIAIGSA